EAKWLRPADWKQQCGGIAERPTLLLLTNLPDELDSRRLEQRLHFLAKIIFIHGIDFGRDLERHVQTSRNLDRLDRILLRGDAPEEGQIASPRGHARIIQVKGQAVINGAHEIR